MSLNITNVRVTPFESRGAICGFATVEIDGCLVIDGWRIFNGSNGMWVSGPSKQDKKSGEWKDTVYIKNKEEKKLFQERVLETYREVSGQAPAGNKGSARSNKPSQIPSEYAGFDKPARSSDPFDDVPPPKSEDYIPSETPDHWFPS